MAVHGHLHSMSLADLLLWSSKNRKSGILEVERNKICRRLVLDEGRISGCSTNDPPSRLGQFLLSRGLITQEDLTDALERQEVTRKNLGSILHEMGVIEQEEILKQVAAKAEENIYALFDWDDAVFRYDENVTEDSTQIAVDLAIEDVLVEGLKRRDQLARIRAVFSDSGLVLGRSDTPVPPEVQASAMAARILEAVNGERTLAEVLLRAHASEYLVIKFLYTLFQREIIEIVGRRDVDDAVTLLDTLPEPPLPELSVDPAARDAREPAAEAEHDDAIVDADRLSRYPELASDIELAQRLMQQSEYGQALQVLNACYRAHPGDGYLRHLVLRVESSYLEAVRRDDVRPTLVPVKRVQDDDLAGVHLQPSDLFLLGMIDGTQDVKSILWVAPMREVDIFQALQRLRDQGLIELAEPTDEPAERDAETSGDPQAVQWVAGSTD